MSSVYTITKIARKTWRISEAGKVNCYLLEGDTSAWKKGAEIVLSYLKDGYSAWNGHFEGALSLNMANRVYALVNEIIDKYKRGQLQKNDSPYLNDHAMPNVRFRMDNILKSLND